MGDTFHIAFGINDAYSKYIRVIINSTCVNNPHNPIYFHILSDYISKRNKKLLQEEIDRFQNAHMIIHIIDKGKIEGIYCGNWNISTWYRIFLPEILPADVKKILYLDADTVVNGSLKDIFELSMDGKSIAAVHDLIPFAKQRADSLKLPKGDKYICAGVMLINLDYWRQNNIMGKILEFAKSYADILYCPDQDSINVVCQNSKKLLPFKYGYVREFYNKKNSVIIHYSGYRPWLTVYKPPYHEIWKKYNNNLKRPLNFKLFNLKLWMKIKITSIFKFK